jgi:hypothetical protein
MEMEMINGLKAIRGLVAVMIIISGCGGTKKTADNEDLSGFFPEELGEINLVKSSEIRTFEGQSLYEYINGGAEIYHLYNFIEVATCSYETGDKEIILDIYLFETDDDAYGLYSSIKPSGPGNVKLGVEGFSTENSIDFVKGGYIIRIVGFDQSETTKDAIEILARSLDATIKGTTEKPATFGLLPQENLIDGSEKIMAESFLGQIFLDNAYAADYEVDGDEVTLFVVDDSSEEKYIQWREQVEMKDFESAGLPYDNGQAFLFNNGYYGDIVAGLIQGRLAGLIGYKESHREFLSRWLESLKKRNEETI